MIFVYIRKFLIPILLVWIGIGNFASCSSDIPPEDVALQSAKVYYEQLIAGDVSAFVDGMYMKDSVVPSYREQLETNMYMYLGQQKDDHKGIVRVETLRTKSDSILNVVNAFLLLVYADSTREEIVVPMMEQNGIWKMR